MEGSIKTLKVLKFIAKQAEPVKPKDIEEEFSMKYATVMAHLAALERENFIEKAEDGFIGSLELATFWAARKRLNNQRQKQLDQENALLN